MNSSIISPFTALSLKLVGLILIFSSLLDYIVLAIPFNPLDSRWQITYISTVVDRGIIPMVGMAFLLTGYWIGNMGKNAPSQSSGLDVRLPVFILSSFLGLVFLLFVPLYLNNLRTISGDALEQINQGAAQAETRLQTEFDQLNNLLGNEQQLKQLDQRIQQLDQAITSGQVQGRQLTAQQRQQLQEQKQRFENLRSLRDQPEEIEKRLSELQTRLRSQKLDREKLAKTETLKRGLRIGLSSLMLTGGYSAIGWLGIKNMGGSAPRPKKTPRAPKR